MNNFTIYDKSGVSYSAELIDDIPEFTNQNPLAFPNFSFITKYKGGMGGISWLLNGVLHRKDGPAMEFLEHKRWFLDGKEYTEGEYLQQVRKL